MAWVYLAIASIFEIGWPIGFKLSQLTSQKIAWIIVSVISMAISGFFLWLAQRSIPIGTAYTIWTGIGAFGTFFIGIIFFKDTSSFLRMFSALLIIVGVIGLRFSH